MAIADGALRNARNDLLAFERASAIRVGDLDALAEYLISAPEKERRSVSEPLTLVWTAWSVLEGLPRDEAARRVLLIAVGTASPSRNSFGPNLHPETMGHAWLHPRTTELFRARPLAVQERIHRWWWLESWSDDPLSWDLWRALILEGTVPEPESESESEAYARGALHVARPWSYFADSRENTARRQAWIAADPPVLELVRRGYRSVGGFRWVRPETLVPLVSDGLLTTDDVVATAVRVVAQDSKADVAARQRKVVDALGAGPEAFVPYVDDLLAILTHGRSADSAWALERLRDAADAGTTVDADRLRAGLQSLGSQGSVSAVKAAIAFAQARLAATDVVEILLACLENPKAEQQQRAAKALAEANATAWSDSARERAAALLGSLAPRSRSALIAALGVAPGAGPEPPRPADAGGVTIVATTHAPLRAPRASRVEAVANPDEIVEVAIACIEGGADGIQVERLLDAIARFPDRNRVSRTGLERIVHAFQVNDRGQIAAQTRLRAHVLLVAYGWATGQPVALAPEVMEGVRSRLHRPRTWLGRSAALGRSAGIALPPRLSLAPPAVESWRDTYRDCQAWGPAGHVCARALEMHEGRGARARSLMALPSTSLGELDPSDFTDRLEHAARDGFQPLPFDSVAALLRLPDACDDASVVEALRASKSPLARAALAIWGETVPGGIPREFRPIVASRTRSVTRVHAGTFPYAQSFRSEPETGASVWAEYSSPPPTHPDMWDPIGAAAWLASEDGVARRKWEYWRQADVPLGSPVSAADVRAALAASPASVDTTLAACAASWARIGLSERTSTVPDTPLLYVIDRARALGPGGHAYVALALASASASARAVTRDLLAGDLWDPGELARAISAVGALGQPTARRTTELLGEIGREPAAAVRIVDTLGRVMAELDVADRDLSPYLNALEIATDTPGAGALTPEVTAYLRRVADHGGSRAAISRRILSASR